MWRRYNDPGANLSQYEEFGTHSIVHALCKLVVALLTAHGNDKYINTTDVRRVKKYRPLREYNPAIACMLDTMGLGGKVHSRYIAPTFLQQKIS